MPQLLEATSSGTDFSQSTRWIHKICKFIFLAVCAETVFSIPYRSTMLVTHRGAFAWSAGVASLVLAAVLFRYRDTIINLIQGWISRLPLGSAAWFWSLLFVGLSARIAWAAAYHITLKSDGLEYFRNALSLTTGQYAGTKFPPGFSLFEAPFFMIFGAHVWTTYLCALLLFVWTYWTSYKLGLRLHGRNGAGLAAAVVALWPTLVMLVSSNSKEYLILPLITTISLLYLLSLSAAGYRRWLLIVSCGVLVGLAALCQPGFLLFPFVFTAHQLLSKERWYKIPLYLIVVTCSMLVTIMPWTLRNYRIYNRVILISTNGGSVFYRANNAHANASYMVDDLGALPKNDFASDRIGYQMAEDWIRNHPLDFIALCVRKQVNFLGDDGAGPYETMRRDLDPPRRFYGAAKLLCNLTWLVAWGILLLSVPHLFHSSTWTLWFSVCFLPVAYQLCIDSVFESGGRHHVVYIGLIGVMLALAVVAPERNKQAIAA